jgi:formylglycine-generating enzyme required for sulfatase activity
MKPTVLLAALTTFAFTLYAAAPGMEGAREGELRTIGGIEMVWCPPGEFIMGSPEDESGRGEKEIQHKVKLTRGFWMAKTECTQKQWIAMMGSNPSQFKGGDLPVEGVSWNDVQGWLTKMNERYPLPDGWKWALPTEAQWEYACRAGTETARSGDLDEMAWYNGNSGSKTNPVGTKLANAWGLHDMHGNVSEICQDWYSDYVPGMVTDPTGPLNGTHRVNRDGNWLFNGEDCRSAFRSNSGPDYRAGITGFRVAVVLAP